ncbi:MAG: DNA mismatch repair protein MutS [Tissierellia bacterium]|nr:DNA mismatch repair protein MutS [Tissierellia bacterium]
MLNNIDRSKLTPMMKQYCDLKDRFKDSILLFRLGDFYEMFFDDALTASKALEIVLTKRDCGLDEKAPMCGIPHHVSDIYINKLVNQGFKVALCEQMEDPKYAKGLVERDVVRVITPGTNIDSDSMSKDNLFLMSILVDEIGIGVSYIDISTGDLKFTEINTGAAENAEAIQNEITKVNPTEIIINDSVQLNTDITKILDNLRGVLVTYYNLDRNSPEDYLKNLENKYKNINKRIKSKVFATISLSVLLDYVHRYEKHNLEHLKEPEYIKPDNYLSIDTNSRHNLEIVKSIKDHEFNLIKILDKTVTAMGSRLLYSWIENPLLDIDKIKNRQYIIDAMIEDSNLSIKLDGILSTIYDIERIIGKLSYSRANGKDLVALKLSIERLPDLKALLFSSNSEHLNYFYDYLDTLEDLYNLIENSIVDEPPATIKEGGIIKIGFSAELDNLRSTSLRGKENLIEYELDQRESTGIKNLKIVFNKKTGYFIDVTKSYLKDVPDNYQRVQTLTNSERYTTDELKKIESMIFTSESDTILLEEKIFEKIRSEILKSILRIQKSCNIIARLDSLLSLSKSAKVYNYVKPSFNEDNIIRIENGRHPVVESVISDNEFIPNDTDIGEIDNLVQIITGPNMSGKSTYLRQIAIISIMAQIGSFVPADSANLCIVDKIFTRIGASDNIMQGESTFMVEMKEMSYILRNASKSSLILLDEVGRGTSTYDGLSIAWAIVEYISTKIKAKTLFATHYQEITQLDEKLDNVTNLCVQVEEYNDSIVFLHKIVKGCADRSFGIEVAKLAGFPISVTKRAKNVLKSIEKTNSFKINTDKIDNLQIDFSSYQKEAFIKSIKEINLNEMSPLDALNRLSQLIDESKLIGDD